MFDPRPKQSAPRLPSRPAREEPAPAADRSLPEVPSIEGYTIDELKTEQLVHMIRLEELEASQVALLIRTLTRGHGS
jgi:hypothetical protein